MNYKIRKALPADIATIINLCAEHACYEKAEYSASGKAEQLANYLFCESPKLYCLLACEGEKIIGYTTFMKEFSTWDAGFYMHMDCLYMRPEARSKGIGEALVNAIKAEAKKENITLIQWQTPTWNARAIQFYHRIGASSKDKLRCYLEV
jgi:GNAT superfamily N-acetyltransferase